VRSFGFVIDAPACGVGGLVEELAINTEVVRPIRFLSEC
jgi:hypothetical protein